MSFIGRFFIGIFGVLGALMLFIMLFRLTNSNGAYIGLSDIYYFFKTQPWDTFGSFTRMFEHITETLDDFKKSFIDFSPFTTMFEDGFQWYEIFTVLLEGFKYLFNIALNLSKMVFLPLTTLYYVIEFIIGIFVYIIQFFTFIITS